jgi:cell wall-associated NlpC family hydrolase
MINFAGFIFRQNKQIFLLILTMFFLLGCSSNDKKGIGYYSKSYNTTQKESYRVSDGYDSNTSVIRIFPLNNYPISADYWLSDLIKRDGYNKVFFPLDLQNQRFEQLIQKYYGNESPWSADLINKTIIQPKTLYMQEVNSIKAFDNELIKSNDLIGYGSNFRAHNSTWSINISYNMGIEQFKNLMYSSTNTAITTTNLLMKAIPTDDPWFLSYKIAGQGYPFDQNQISSLYTSTPVYILGGSIDHQWYLVLTPRQVIGWVHASGIARTTKEFRQNWITLINKNGLAAIIKNQTSLIAQNDVAIGYGYVGSLFPIVDKQLIAVAQTGYNGEANIRYTKYLMHDMRVMPLLATIGNFELVIKSLQNIPYGWGGYNFYNDCSAELAALFTPFGYYLPRNSYDQSHIKTGEAVDLSKYSISERLKYIINNGLPFRTLIHIPGHIMLYVGNKEINGIEYPVVYNDIWGLRPADSSYRDVIGESLFFPLMIKYPENTDLLSLLDRKTVELVFLN